MMDKRFWTVFCALVLLLLAACSEQAEEAQVTEEKPAPREMKVLVPESVVGKWKSVKIALQDQQEGTENIYQVDIGGSFRIPDTALRVTVETFMPSFSVNSERATSVSNKATNPAVQLVVRDGENEIHRGWVFGHYPDRHQFENPRYKFILLDYKPQR
jgi:hypothetical protein